MKNIRYKAVIALLLISVIVLAASCGGGSRTTSDSSDGNSVKVYYLTQLKTGLYPHNVRLKGDNAREQVRYLLDLLSTPPKDTDYTNSIPSSVIVRSFTLRSGSLTISFSRSYRNLNKVNESLLRASVVKTLVQLKSVDSVTFRVVKDAIVDSQGNAIGAMTADSFIDDFDFEQDSTKAIELMIYAPATDGSGLIREKRKVYINENVPVAQAIMKQMQKKPDSSKAEATLPQSVKLLSVSVNDGICYVDIDQSLDNIDSKVSTSLRIYSIVDSLCELDQVNRVQIIVGSGDNASIITDDEKNGTYSPDYDLVVK